LNQATGVNPLVAYLVGGIPTPLKNMKVSWDDYSQYMEKIKNNKPPTSHVLVASSAPSPGTRELTPAANPILKRWALNYTTTPPVPPLHHI